MRHCELGDHWVDVSKFGVNKGSKDGIDYSCRACMNIRQNARRAENGRKDKTEYIDTFHVGSYTEMRHPDEAVMKEEVDCMEREYAGMAEEQEQHVIDYYLFTL